MGNFTAPASANASELEEWLGECFRDRSTRSRSVAILTNFHIV